MAFRSPLVAAALDLEAALRAEFAIVREAEYRRAEDAIGGAMVNARGRAKGIKGWDLFSGAPSWREAYASDELLDYWQVHPLITWERWLRQYVREHRLMLVPRETPRHLAH